MGIDRAALLALLHARQAGVDFQRTLVVGRQQIRVDATELAKILGRHRLNASLVSPDRYADALFQALGAADLRFLDASLYEGADLVVDLNVEHSAVSIPSLGSFSLVVESGTLEHVYHAAVGLQTLQRLVRPGGHLLLVTPCDGWPGHGFFQFSPEFLFRTFERESGFAVRALFLERPRRSGASRWWRVVDPASAGRRIEFFGGPHSSLVMLAQRIGEVAGRAAPMQSDYVAAWRGTTLRTDRPKLLPRRAWNVALRIRRRLLDGVNGGVDPRYFQSIRENDIAAVLQCGESKGQKRKS